MLCISMEPNLLGLLCTVRGLLQADTGGLYFGALALFNTITTAPFSPDLLPFFHMYKSLSERQNFPSHSLLNG